jgi:hypothetical protein
LQKLEENDLLLRSIVEKQNAGKFEECQEFQKRLHENLALLAKLADNQATPASQ